jgi:site-specific DNA-cytosine methylase
MMGVAEHGLRTITNKGLTYSVEVVSSVNASDYGVCQDRPRTLFFGVRSDSSLNAVDVVNIFRKMSRAYGNTCGHIDDFIMAGSASDVDGLYTRDDDELEKLNPTTSDPSDTLDKHIEYCIELNKAVRTLANKFPDSLASLIPEDQRPSKSIPEATARIRATVDALSAVYPMHMAGCRSDTTCRCHPLADVSQRADRAAFRVDGWVPTLMTGSRIFSYKLGAWITQHTLAHSMGYTTANLSAVGPSAGRSLVGNGYAVPVCACAVVTAGVVTGHIIGCKK